MVMGSSQVAVTETSGFAPSWKKEFRDIQATIKCGFALNFVRDTIRTCSQMNLTDEYSQHTSMCFRVQLQ